MHNTSVDLERAARRPLQRLGASDRRPAGDDCDLDEHRAKLWVAGWPVVTWSRLRQRRGPLGPARRTIETIDRQLGTGHHRWFTGYWQWGLLLAAPQTAEDSPLVAGRKGRSLSGEPT